MGEVTVRGAAGSYRKGLIIKPIPHTCAHTHIHTHTHTLNHRGTEYMHLYLTVDHISGNFGVKIESRYTLMSYIICTVTYMV